LGTSVSLYPSLSGGVWTSSDSSIVSVSRVTGTSYTAYATAIGNGIATVSYTLTTPNSTCSSSTNIIVTVAQQNTPSAIGGPATLCAGSSAVYTTTTTGGVWSTGGYATISNAGVATGTSAGNATINYKVTNAAGCSATATKAITVLALPSIPTISFAPGTSGNITSGAGYCKNQTFTLVGKPANGIWSKTGVITATPTGTASTTTSINTGNSTGATSITYTITSNTNGCSNSRTISSTVVACRGIGQATGAREQFILYPNPAHQFISLKVEKLIGTGSIVVTDLYGKQLKHQSLSMGTNTVDVSNFAKGMYLVTIVTEQGSETRKVVVE
jgi:hypothetical protein